MAKSNKGKWKRRLGKIKRRKNAVKELERLKGILGKSDWKDNEINALYKVKTVDELMKEKREQTEVTEDKEQHPMETSNSSSSKYNSKTFKDKDGNYPEWMSSNRVKKLKRLQKKKKKGAGRQ